MSKSPYTMFGKTKQIPVVTYTDGKIDTPPKAVWQKEMWIEREEDMYGIPPKGTVRIVDRKAWMVADRMSREWATEWHRTLKCDEHMEGMSDGADDVAAAIRALK